MCSWVACLHSFCAAIRMSAAFLRSVSDSMGRPPRFEAVTVHTTKLKGRPSPPFCRLSAFSLVDLAVGEPQGAGHWPPHWRHILCEKRKPDRKHPEAENRQEAEPSAPGQLDSSRDTNPYRIRLAQSVDIATCPSGM